MSDTTQEELPPLPKVPNYRGKDGAEYDMDLCDWAIAYRDQCIATLKEELAQCQSDRQREHDARCTAAGSLEAAQSQAAAMAGLLEKASLLLRNFLRTSPRSVLHDFADKIDAQLAAWRIRQ